jgi:glycosyltransferase involved in cell wall biosynthesis
MVVERADLRRDLNAAPSKKRKILFVIRNLGKGGAEKVMSILLEGLDRNKIEPSCVFYDSWHVYKIPGDVRVHSLGLPGTGRFFKKISRFLLRIIKIRRIIDTEKPDVVFSFLNGVNFATIIATLLSKSEVRLIVSERNTPSLHTLKRSGRLTGYLIRKLYPKANKIVAVSEGVKRDLVTNFHLPAGNIHVIYNPVDAEKIARLAKEEITEHAWFKEGVPIVINVASLSEKKGQSDLLRAFRIVKEKFPVRLVILGEGGKEGELKELALKLGINEDVAFLGFQPNPYKFMARSSLFVLSSLWEGLPNVILEAMACGVPVVSTDCPSGPNEIIENEVNGLLVPVRNELKLAEVMLDLLENEHTRKKISLNASKRITKFSIPSIVGEYQRILVDGV